MIIFNLHTLCLTLYYTYQDYLPFTYTVSHSILYCCALTKRSISQNFQNTFFGIIHISPTISILCQKILAENCLQCTFLGTSKHSIQFFVSDSTIKTLYLTLGCIIHQIQRTFTTLRYRQSSQIMYDTYQ